MRQKSSSKVNCITVFSMLLILLATFSVVHAQDWYDTEWQYRKAITVDADQVDTHLTNFPLLVDITDTDLASEAQPDGTDIVFTSDDGITKLDHEIESYSAGDLVAWVRVPSLSSSTDTVIYIYYGNATASNQENPTGVWDSSYVMVQHLDETAGTHNDSTSYGNDGSPQGSLNQNVEGKIGKADEFDGIDDSVSVSNSTSLQLNDHSMEMWVKRGETGTGEGMLLERRGSSLEANYFVSMNKYGNQEIFPGFSDGTGWYSFASSSGVMGNTDWHHIGYTFDSVNNVQKVYVDGVEEGSRSGVAAIPSTSGTQTLRIGQRYDGAVPFDGIIDEVRVSSSARSSDWISTSYANQASPGTFYSRGDEQSAETPVVSNVSPSHGTKDLPITLTQVSFDLRDYQEDLMDYSVTTSPDIGSDAVSGVSDGNYTVSVSGVNYDTTYTLYINVTDGINWTYREFNFATVSDKVVISSETPEDGATGVTLNPTLQADLFDAQGDSIDWEIKTNASGTWEVVDSGILPDGDGVVSASPTTINEGSTEYHWSVRAKDSGTNVWVEEMYSFTTKFPFEVRWSNVIGAQHRRGAAALADLNNDGYKEVVVGFMGGIRAYNQSDGSTLWTYYDGDIHSGGTMIEIADLNKDGVPEVVCPLAGIIGSSGILALHGDDGSLYWKRRDLGGTLNDYNPLIFDIDGNGYPTIFTASKLSTDPGLWALNYDGTTRAEAHDTWKPCWGGISLMDHDSDGRFEIYLTDAGSSLGGSRVWSYQADDLTLRWSKSVPGGVNAEHPQLIDVTGDGIRDVVVYPGQCYPGQTKIYVLSAADGSVLKYKNADGYISTCLVASIYDIDSDGNPELIGVTMNSDRDFIPATPTIAHMAVHDLVTFNRDAVVPLEHGNSDQPRVGNVYGDEGMEIVVPDGNNSLKIYSDSYELIEDIYLDSSCTLRHAKIADIDSDGYNEIVITAGGSPCDGPGSKVWVIDTDGVAPEVDPRVEVQSYSEYRLGVAEYVVPPQLPAQEPTISDERPNDGAINVFITMSTLSFTLEDAQDDVMDYIVTTSPDIGSGSATGLTNGYYTIPISGLNYDTTYQWTVNVTDGTHPVSETFSFTTGPEPLAWYSDDWLYRKEIVIDSTKVSEDLMNFPVVIDITDDDLAAYAQPNGDDILFTDYFGTKVAHEIELYEVNGSAHLVAWVNLPFLSSTIDTIVYLYYANSTIPNQENAEAVWDSHHVMVQHLDETSGTHEDSTVNSNDGTPYNLASQDAIGKIDGADEFDATDDVIDVGTDTSLDIFGPQQDFSIFMWVKRDATTEVEGFFSSGSSGDHGIYFGSAFENEDDLKFMSISRSIEVESSNGVINDNNWHHVGVTADRNGIMHLWVDGVPVYSESISSHSTEDWNRLDDTYKIGTDRSEDNPFDGTLDEVRVSDIVRSSGWISTSYANQHDPSVFANVGNVQVAHAPLISNENPADGATSIAPSLSGLSFHLLDPDGDLIDYTVTTNPDIGSDSATGVTDGTYTVPVSGLSYNTTYEWTISVTDGIHPVSNIVTFTTELDIPIISLEDPQDETIDVQLNPTLKAEILDEQGDAINWEILININDSWQLLNSGTLPGGSGTVSASPTDVDQYNTLYSWKVRATGGGEWVETVYSFTTTENKMSFAAFTDSHIGGKDLYSWGFADHLDLLAQDIMNNTVPCDFTVHLGDIVMHSTSFVEGEGIPPSFDHDYNKFKPSLLQHLNMPFMAVSGNHDMTDYYGGSHSGFPVNNNDPFNLVRSLIKATEMNSYPYAFMKNNILFIALPETDYHMFTKPTIYEYVEYITRRYQDNTTIILSHQAIEDTTIHDGGANTYRGKQDREWWAALFRNNPQIKMWMHGHQHMLDWYQSDHSSGLTFPVSDFGHEMAFSHPYSQADWGNYHEEDRIVIYSISPTEIATRAWENNGAGGQWVSGYDHNWSIATTYDENAHDWYSFPLFIQDGEIQETDMKVFSPNITLELIGTQPMELFYDPQMQTQGTSWGGENILGFGDDLYSEATPTLPGTTVQGPADLSFPPKYPGSEFQGGSGAYWEDGKTGQPYHFFPVGTSHAAVPGATYTVTLTARSDSGSGTINVDLSASDWGSGTQYSTLAGSTQQVISHTFGTEYETVTGTYTVPSDVNAWFMQGYLNFTDTTDYDISLFSIKRSQDTDTTDNFELSLNGNWYSHPGTLQQYEKSEFIINPLDLADENGVIEITSDIEGNHFGMARIIYNAPLLMGRNARFNVTSIEGNNYNITLQDDLSYSSDTFKMFPLNGKYGSIEVTSDDDSATRQVSDNGNEWIECNTPTAITKVTLDITYGIAAPIISNESPDNLASNVGLNPTLQADIRDLQGEQINWEIKTNASGVWVTIASGTLPGGEGTVSAVPTSMSEYDTAYNWSVSAIDIGGTGEWVTKTYRFTTRPENYLPVISNVIPADNALNVLLNPTLSVEVSDEDGDLMDIVFKANVYGSWEEITTYTDVGEGRYNAVTTNMDEYDTTYFWRVEVNDGMDVTTATYSFITILPPGSWWNGSWQYRKEITIDHEKVEEDLTYFPVLIEFTDSEVAAHAQTDADDLMFTDYYGVPLSHEIEEYENSPGHLVAWVEVPFLSSTVDTTLYMYYGNSGADNQEDVEGTWDGSNHVMVQHLEEASGTHYDATSYHNDSTTVVVTDQDAAGRMDGADEFDGTDDYIRVPNAASLQFGDGSFTAEAWIYPRSVTDTGGVRIVNNRGTAGGGSYKGYQLKIKDLSGNWYFGDASIDDATGNYKAYEGTNTYVYNQWHQVVMVYEADSELRFYVNGELDGILPVGAYGDITNSLPTAIGASLADQGVEGADDRQYFDGIIDEVRLSVEAMSLGWIATEFNNQSDPDTFLALGSEETQGAGCTGHGECGFCEKCEGGSCVVQDGEDAKEECEDEPCSTGLCDGAGGCGIEPDTTVCRPAMGTCDVAETCDGLSVACPADTVEPGGALCRDIQGDCDLAETCDGLSATCPADTVEPGGTLCRDILGDCDLAETCDGLSAACPADGYLSGNVCRGTAGDCDAAEICSGSSADCPPDGKSTGVCRVSAGECDLAESCDGVGNNCPADGKSTGLCRASVGECDLAESCDGVSNNCPADQLEPAATLCREAVSECDFAEYCTGDSTACPNDEFQPNATPCDDGLYCTQADECSEGECRGVGDPCPDNEEYCDGVEYCEEDTEDYLCSLTGDPCNPLTCDELDDTCLDSAVTLIIANAYGFSGTIDIELINEMDFVREVHLDVCNVDHHAWLHISTDSCSTTARTGGFICTISDQLNGCVRVDLTSPGDLINPGETGAIASLNYTLDVIAPVGDYADLMPENIEVRDDENVLLPVTPKPGKVGAVEIDSDDDGTPDHLDNCPHEHNPEQEDTSPPQGNEIGDACDCEGNFDCDQDVDGADAAIFKFDFGRSRYSNPCTNANPCHGDFDCDVDVDGTDASLFKSDFGRSQYQSPCPQCEAGDWCSYE